MDDRQGMDVTRNQRTLRSTAAIEGIGYWSGRDVRVEFRPAAPHTGIVFVRSDLPGRPRIPAVVANRIEMPRRTVLSSGGVAVEMVEHIMAALAGMHVDNCEVWVDQPEMPGCDGSRRPSWRRSSKRRPPNRTPAGAARGGTGAAAGQRGMLDRGPSGGRRQDRNSIRVGLRQRKPHRSAVAGSDAFSPLFPREPGRQPHFHAAARSRSPCKSGGWDRGRPSTIS